jgi:HCOMODA/2-hydroxy-3-carboxy-muconic semialdehyde decarboxylase
MCATIGAEVPIWEPRKNFGDTDMLVSDMAQGRDLAKAVGPGKSALMRGHGSVVAGPSLREAVYIAVYLEVNAHLQMDALRFGKKINFLSPGEIQKILDRQAKGKASEGFDRAWEGWCNRAGVPFKRHS